MIDLHIHSKHSDGTDTLIEILKKAQKLNLEYISITDHDNCNIYEEIKSIEKLKYYKGTIVPGVEIKCCIDNIKIEVLGYKIDTDTINKWLKDFYKDKTPEKLQQKYFDKLYEICKIKGLKLDEKSSIEWNPSKEWASIVIYNQIKKHTDNQNMLPNDLWESSTVFSKKYCVNPKYDFYIDKSDDYPSLKESIINIKKAGGLSFLAHFYAYGIETELLNKIIDNNIDGIECFYSTFSKEQTQYLIDVCSKKNLYISGGTDYHGDNKKDISMGTGFGNLNISSSIISKWL